MSNWSLVELVEELEREGQLARVAAEVDPRGEIGEITRQIARSRGPALLFERVRGHQMPVLTNLLGHERRLAWALGVDSLDGAAERLLAGPRGESSGGWLERLRLAGAFGSAASLLPKTVKTAACQQVVRLGTDVALDELPALQQPGESRGAITAGQLVTEGRDAVTALSSCRLELLDRNRLALVLPPTTTGARHVADARQAGIRLPVAAVLGGHVAYRCLPGLPLLGESDPWTLGGLMLGRPLERVRCRTHELQVPADGELVIEGYLDPRDEPVSSGAFATASGHLAQELPAEVVHVAAITHRSNPIFPAVVVDEIHEEATVLGKLHERLLLGQLRRLWPEVVELAIHFAHTPGAWLAVSIEKSYARQARKVASALLAMAPEVSAKWLVVVDDDVDVHDLAAVTHRLGQTVHAPRDTWLVEGPGHWLDPASLVAGGGATIAIDATNKLPDEQGRAWPAATTQDAELVERVRARWKEYGLSG